MPRRNSPVKPKQSRGTQPGTRRLTQRLPQSLIGRSQGAIDIHFHGAFGVDLMTASRGEFSDLCGALWDNGVAGFCPTTLSTTPEALLETVGRLGEWIRERTQRSERGTGQGAVPIGIHLEGPFINSSCCGAHPSSLIRRLDWEELERLWNTSRETLKILTVAPETLSAREQTRLGLWAKSRGIALSLGHSKATEAQAGQAFDAGFRGITHAWNALGFHQRSPGPLGAALGKRSAYVELIIDQVHVAPTLIRWTQKLHPADRLCFISDCAPAAETSGETAHTFGPLEIQYFDGACRFPKGSPHEGALAGGGKLLTRSFCEWLEKQASKTDLKSALRRHLPSITRAPLWALQVPSNRFARHAVEWRVSPEGKLSVSPT